MIVIGGVVLGFYFPQLWLGSKIARRQKSIRRAMPDALDLLTICVEAGLGFDAALAKVSEKWESELSLAFARVLTEIQLGKLRREALRDMADRIDHHEALSGSVHECLRRFKSEVHVVRLRPLPLLGGLSVAVDGQTGHLRNRGPFNIGSWHSIVMPLAGGDRLIHAERVFPIR